MRGLVLVIVKNTLREKLNVVGGKYGVRDMSKRNVCIKTKMSFTKKKKYEYNI